MAVTGSGKGIQIVVGTDYNDRDLKRAQRDLDRLKREAAASATPMQKLGATMRGMVGPAFAMAGAAVAGFALKLAVDGVQAAMEEERQLAILKQTLDNVGQSFAMDEVNTFIDNLRFATGVADDELRPAFMKLVGATHNAEAAQRLLAVAVDTSVGSGKDLSSVSMAMAKAVAGSSVALKRLIPELDATAVAGGGADKVIAALSARFGGSAAAAAGTFAGQLQRLQDGFHELTESFGKGFIGALEEGGATADGMAQSLRDLQPAVEELGAALGGIGKAISDNQELIDYFTFAVVNQLKVISGAIDAVGWAWNGLVGIVTGSWPEDETERAAKSTSQLAYEFGRSGKGAALLAQLVQDRTKPAVYQLGDSAANATDSMSLLRAEIRRTTVRLGFLATAFDNANAAMDRREAMQGYKTALKEYLADPSANTRDAVVQAMMGAALSFEDPAKGAEFTAQAVGGIIDAARKAGIKVPEWLANIATAADNQLDPIASLKQEMETIPTNIPVKITLTTVGGKPPGVSWQEWYGGAAGGSVPKYYARGGSAKGSDTVPAMLTPGEFVIRKSAVDQFGAGLFSQLNRGINPLAGMSTGRGGASSTVTNFNFYGDIKADTPAEAARQAAARARLVALPGRRG